MSQIIRIDARVLGFEGSQVRILSVCDVESGLIMIEKVVDWSDEPVAEKFRDTTVIVTDAPNLIKNWHLSFSAQDHLEQVIQVYVLKKKASQVKLSGNMARYNPDNVLQTRKVDKNGAAQEFDSEQLNNGHIAIMLSVWASDKIHVSHKTMNMDATKKEIENHVDQSMLPFSIGGGNSQPQVFDFGNWNL